MIAITVHVYNMPKSELDRFSVPRTCIATLVKGGTESYVIYDASAINFSVVRVSV